MIEICVNTVSNFGYRERRRASRNSMRVERSRAKTTTKEKTEREKRGERESGQADNR